MFFGREKELQMLSEMYNSRNFCFLVMYGRHRSGRTCLLREFAKKKDVIYFCAQTKNSYLCLADFTAVLRNHFGSDSPGAFPDWGSAFSFIPAKSGTGRLIIIIEELHRIAGDCPDVLRQLQLAIDRSWRAGKIFLIISESDISFVEKAILDYSSPLQGRVTGQMAVTPFDYLDSSRFLSDCSEEYRLLSYAILGGTPCYANQFDSSLPLSENIAMRIMSNDSFLNDEPQAVLRTWFRDPAVYNSILEAIACGAQRLNDISAAIREESQKCAKYINALRSVGLIDRITPVGNDESGKRSLYVLSDNYFSFWYRFVFSNQSLLTMSDTLTAVQELLRSENFHLYIEEKFKGICLEYVIRKAKAAKLPFAPYAAGRWWSSSSGSKQIHGIDILAVDRNHSSAIFGKCRFDGLSMDEPDLDELIISGHAYGRIDNAYYYLFSRCGFSDALINKSKKNKTVKLLGVEDLFDI